MNDKDRPMEEIDRDMIISRVVDEQASDDDWNQLRKLGEKDAGVWRDLAEAQHEHAELCRAVESAISAADGVDAPVEEYVQTRFTHRVRVVATWGGWAAAAMMALAWFNNPAQLSQNVGDGSQNAGLVNLTPDQALQRYVEEGQRTGQVIEEVPERVLIETRPMPSGEGVEVIYIRQFIERTRVRNLYRPGEDEYGRLISIPIKFEFKSRASDPI